MSQDDYRFALLYASKRGLRGISEMRFPFLLKEFVDSLIIFQ